MPKELSRDELIALARRQDGQLAAQAERLAAQDRQITALTVSTAARSCLVTPCRPVRTGTLVRR